jgi:thiamine-phosphate pyrophosphorylase
MFDQNGIYLVLSSDHLPDRDPVEAACAAIDGGVDVVQMREKRNHPATIRSLGSRLAALCRERRVLFLVNDDPWLAADLGADGVHLGQEDLMRIGIGNVRKTVGRGIIGLSTHSLTQFEAAQHMDIDYAAFGPLYPTRTKDYHIGTTDLAKVHSIARKPTVLIGGIDENNAPALVGMGYRRLAVLRSILQAKDISAAARQLHAIVHQPEPVMEILLNGKKYPVASGVSLRDLLLASGYRPERSVIEQNGTILHKGRWDSTLVQPGDRIEIVGIVSGG